jgi:hypothetical protein
MKRLLLCAIVGSLSLVATAQSEQDQAVVIRGYQIDLPVKAYQLYSGDMNLYSGSYDMSNGQPLSLRHVGNRLYATVGNQAPKLLVASAHNVLVSTDRQMRLTLNRQSNGEFEGQVWLVGARTASTGNAGMQYAQLVSFR